MIKRKRWEMLALALLSAVLILAGGSSYISNVQHALWMQSVMDVREVTAQGGHAFEVYTGKDMEMVHGLAQNLSQKMSWDEDSILNRLVAFGETEINYCVVNLDEGFLYSSNHLERTTLTAEKLAEYQKLSGSGIQTPYLSDETGQKMLGYYECFRFEDGARGVVQKEQLLSNVADEFSLSFYEGTGFSYIVDQEGNILIRSGHRNSNRTFLNVFDIIDLGGKNGEALEDFRNAIAENKSGVARFFSGEEENVYAYVPLSGTDGWYLISIIPNSVIMKQAEHILKSSQVFVLLIAAGIIIFSVFLILMRQNRKKVEEKEKEIRYREQLFSILANNTDDVFVMLTTAEHKVEYVSPNAERVLGVLPEEVKNSLASLKMDEDKRNGEDYFAELLRLESGSIAVRENERIHKKTGEHRWFLERVYRVMLDNTDKLIVTLSDRTQEKTQKQALEQALRIAEEANQSKSTFLSNMSHDIRTPMNAIVGLSTLLERDADNPVLVREHTRKITASSHHLLGLMNDVLDMSKIESGKTTLNITEVNLAEIVEELVNIIRPQAKAKHQTFEVSVFEVQSDHLLGDKLRISQILLNILSNAVKYTQPGGRVEMNIRQMPKTRENYASLRFCIKDNGAGMSEEYQGKIFEAFTREVNSTTNQVQGTGLGMAITKNLVELMGGTISIESELGKGSTFIVDLELRIQEQVIDPEFWVKYGIAKMLVVDDDPEVCTGIVEAMAQTGVKVQYALDGESAIEEAEKAKRNKEDYDLILLDWKMPGMDGIETAREIRERVSGDVPLMILSAYDWNEIEEEAAAVGVSSFLMKPFFLFNFKQTIVTMKTARDTILLPEADNILEGKHILAAEDNELNSEILLELLDMVGASCDVMENGEEALKRFLQSTPGEYDLILMDVQMPVMNGYEAAKAIRACAHPMAKEIPIIAMTANAFVEDIKNALDSGMDAHGAKPLDLELLGVVVQDVFHKKLRGNL